MKSMTGYGKGEAIIGGKTVIVELKSVNHRFLDISVKMPSFIAFAEDSIRKLLQSKLSRGHIDCYVSVYNSGIVSSKEYCANYPQIESYLSVANGISAKYSIDNDINVSEIMKLPGVLVEKQNDDDQEQMLEIIHSALDSAIKGLITMRAKEGENLRAVIHKHLEVISDHSQSISIYAPMVVESYREKLKNRVQEYLQNVTVDESKLLTEVATYSDKVNIDEEINRLFSHISQFIDMTSTDQPIGKKLDFLVQEMNREVNTIGSKANFTDITKCVVELKNELEKLREQIQNIE